LKRCPILTIQTLDLSSTLAAAQRNLRKGQIMYKKITTNLIVEDVDRCMLYVLRCAVYYASTLDPDPRLLQWWNWKDRDAAANSGSE